jgi:hypothetical protein
MAHQQNNSTKFFSEAAAAPHWADMGERDHFVQIYSHEQQIIEAVAGYFVNGVRFNEACIMIGTPEHNRQIEKLVRYIEPRVDAAIADGSFIILDAHETLSEFMVDGKPSKDLFEDVVGGIIKKAGGMRKRLRAFGEMVAILADSRNGAAAVELEMLWNALAKSLHFRLFCVYPHQTLLHPDAAPHYDTICSAHTHVIGQTVAHG